MSIPITAWVISLDASQEPVKQLTESLTEQGFRVQIFPAVDGRQAMPEVIDGEKLSQLRSMVNRRSPLTPSEVGCYLSHYRLIKKAFAEGEQKVLIFEDDVVVEEGLYPLVQSIFDLGPQAHLVRLMALKLRKRRVVGELTGQHELVRPLRGALGAQGYIVNRDGMRKIIEFGRTISMPIDKLYDSFFLFGLNCYSVEPHAMHETVHPSSIAKRDKESVPAWVYVAWHVNKLYRSLLRKVNYLMNLGEYWGGEKPGDLPGKSARLRD